MATSDLSALKLECAFNPKHFVCRQPIVLKCNGCSIVCLNCISEQVDYTGKFRCPLCQNEHKKETVVEKSLTYQVEQAEYRLKLREELRDMLNEMSSKAEQTKNSIKEKFSVKNKRYIIGNLFDFLDQSILVRVESVKMELEKTEVKVNRRIDRYRDERARLHSRELDEVNKKFEILQTRRGGVDALRAFEMLMKHLASFEARFSYEHLKSTGKDKSEASLTEPKCHFYRLRALKRDGSRLPNRTILGHLNGLCYPNFIDRDSQIIINDSQLEIVFLNSYVKSCCGVAEILGTNKTNQIAMTDYSSYTIKLFTNYDSHECVDLALENIDMFRLVRFKNFYAICTDCDETSLEIVDHQRKQTSLFICDMDLNRVLIYDLAIRKLKRIITGTLSEDEKYIDEFECPRDICYYDRKIYVLDQVKNSIDIFTSCGDYLRSFYFNSDFFTGREPRKLVENPLSVRVNLNTMAIIDWKKSVVLFDLEFNLRGVIEQHDLMSICLVSDHLNPTSLKIFLHSQSGEFLGYRLFEKTDQDCEFSPKLIFKKGFTLLKCSSEFMIYSINSKAFILTLGWAKSVAVIRF